MNMWLIIYINYIVLSMIFTVLMIIADTHTIAIKVENLVLLNIHNYIAIVTVICTRMYHVLT